MDKKEKKGLALGALFGAVAGVVAGILFAPKSGKETREDIHKNALKVAKSAMEEAEKIKKEAADSIKAAEKAIESLSDKAAESAKSHVSKLRHAAHNLSEVVSSVKNGSSTDKDLNSAISQAKSALVHVQTFVKK